jgi:hypothetical protein
MFIAGRSDWIVAGKQRHLRIVHRWLHCLRRSSPTSSPAGLFSAMCGSSLPPPRLSAAGIGDAQASTPADTATGAIANGGSLGILIPPSITFIIHGIATETPSGDCFWRRRTESAHAFRHMHGPSVHALPRRKLQRNTFLWTINSRHCGYCRFSALFVQSHLHVRRLATPSEVAGLPHARISAGDHRLSTVASRPVVDARRDHDSTMILTIVWASALYSYMMSIYT